MERRKLKSLSITDKLKILQKVDEGRKKKKDIAIEFGIPQSTLSTILKNRDALKKNVDNNRTFDLDKKRFSKCMFEDVENHVLQWIGDMQKRDVPLKGDRIRQQARNFALSMGHRNFRASTGWLEKFKARHKILQKSRHGNCQIYRQGNVPSSLPDKSIDDRQAKGFTKAAGVTAVEYVECDEAFNDVQTLTIKEEPLLEDGDSKTEDFLVTSPNAEVWAAFQTIRAQLDKTENVPKNVYDSLYVVEDFLNVEMLCRIKYERS